MARGRRPDRVRKERKQLTCATCGAGNRLAPGVVERGFQRCSHCDAAMPVEGAGSFVIENRAAGYTCVLSPGKSLFALMLGRVDHLPHFILFVFAGDVVTAAFRHVTLHWGAPAVLAWTPTVLYVLGALAVFLQLFVKQEILVTQNRLEAWWRLSRFKMRKRRVGTHGLKLEPKGGRFQGLRLRPRGAKPVVMRTSSETQSLTLQHELEQAIEETRVGVGADEAVTCPGCGAPVATPMEVIEEGGVECCHCGSGLLATKGGVVLQAASLTLSTRPLDESLKLDRRRHRDALEWRLRPELLARPLVALGMMLAGLLLGGAAIAFGLLFLIVGATWRSFGAILAIVFVPLGLSFLAWMFVSAIGRHRLRLDSAVLQHEIRLGPVRVWRRVVPLARLRSLSGEGTPAGAGLKVQTAVREFAIDLPHLDGEGIVVADELFEGLAERLRDMGREVHVCRAFADPEPPK